jgi:uncharacterized membrane protein YcaP (DUF421 family)
VDDLIELFKLSVPVWELVVRGSAIYLFLFLIFRFVVRRDLGSVGVSDILILVIIADASQNAMAGEYKTVTDGFILIATLIGWNVLFNAMGFHFAWFRRFAEPPPLLLVRDGKIIRKHLRLEMMTEDELLAKLRLQGIESLKEVKRARLEAEGDVSVIKRKPDDQGEAPTPPGRR